MEEIHANFMDDCTDESVMEFLESTQERDASVTAEFVKAEVLAKVCSAARANLVLVVMSTITVVC
jgi:hypothetical protein